MSPLALAAVVLNLLVWGGHVLVPWRLASAAEASRRLWALVALPAVGVSILVTAASLRSAPDAAVAWRLHEIESGVLPALLLTLALAAAILGDLVLALGWRRFEPLAWRLLAGIGALALAAVTLGSELVRIGWGPVPQRGALLGAALLRLPLALAAAEVALNSPRFVTPAAGLGLAGAVALWPEPLLAALGADRATLYVAILLLLFARFLPARLRRPAAVAAVALAALFLARAGEVSQALGLTETVPAEALSP